MKLKVIKKSIPSPGFYWISGGASVQLFAGVVIFVRRKRRSRDYKEVSYPYGTFIGLKEVELFVQKSGYPDYNFFSPQVGWDYAINADMVGSKTAIVHHYIMLTYDPKKSTWCRFRYKRCNEKIFFADSGGFQILKGRTVFVDPVDLAAWYNEYADFGMALDIPFSSSIYSENLRDLAKIQKKNLDILCNNIDDTVQLYNIAHGFDSESIKRYIDLVDRPGVDRWAIGLHGSKDFQSLISHIYTVFRHRPAKTYHLLGTSDTKFIPILAWIGKYRSISCDSSSAMQSGINSVYFSLQGYHLKKIKVGWKNNKLLQSSQTFASLPCSCLICDALATSELFYHNEINSVGHRLLTLHNINIMSQYTQAWSELALETKSVQEFQEHIKHIDNRNGEIAKAIDYVEHLEGGGAIIKTKKPWKNDIDRSLIDNRSIKKLIERYHEYYNK